MIPQSMVADYAKDYVDFEARNLRGVSESFSNKIGDLKGEESEAFLRELANGNLYYVVYSYATPIAWVLKDDTNVAYLPGVFYSDTTARHMNLINNAFKDNGIEIRSRV